MLLLVHIESRCLKPAGDRLQVLGNGARHRQKRVVDASCSYDPRAQHRSGDLALRLTQLIWIMQHVCWTSSSKLAGGILAVKVTFADHF
jgi:hypothetical protein